MPSMAARAMREIYRREWMPARARWWLAAAGMRDWYRVLGKRLAPHVPGGDARSLLAKLSARMFTRRYAPLRAAPRGVSASARAWQWCGRDLLRALPRAPRPRCSA